MIVQVRQEQSRELFPQDLLLQNLNPPQQNLEELLPGNCAETLPWAQMIQTRSHLPVRTRTILLKDGTVRREEERQDIAKAWNINNIHPRFTDRFEIVTWFVNDDGFMFVWNKMEQTMKYLG